AAEEPGETSDDAADASGEATPMATGVDRIKLERDIAKAKADIEEAQRPRPLAEENQRRTESRFAKIAAVRPDLAKADFDLRNTTVVAPSDGFVSNLQLAPGAFANPGQAVMSFVSTEKPWVVAVVPE